MKKMILTCTAIFFLALSLNTAHALFSNVDKAKRLMNKGNYVKAIKLLEKHTFRKPKDVEAIFLLAEAYLYTGNIGEADISFNNAVSLAPARKNQVAETCLKVLNGVNDVSAKNEILLLAGRCATSPATRKAIGKKEEQLAAVMSGRSREDLLIRAAIHLGESDTDGIKKTHLKGNSVKIVFYTDKPVTVMNMKKGDRFTFKEISNPTAVKRYMPKSGKSYEITIGTQFECYNDFPLMLKGQKEEFVVLKIGQ